MGRERETRTSPVHWGHWSKLGGCGRGALQPEPWTQSLYLSGGLSGRTGLKQGSLPRASQHQEAETPEGRLQTRPQVAGEEKADLVSTVFHYSLGSRHRHLLEGRTLIVYSSRQAPLASSLLTPTPFLSPRNTRASQRSEMFTAKSIAALRARAAQAATQPCSDACVCPLLQPGPLFSLACCCQGRCSHWICWGGGGGDECSVGLLCLPFSGLGASHSC